MSPSKDKDPGLSPEIARLSALLAKDPNSKMFIPLAEEYTKAGMSEEAVMTLEEGLKAHPFYMSARVMLGRVYFEKGDTDKAQEQFEAVIKAVPDNLFALRKLGEIYKGQGRRTEASRYFKMITLLNPKDEEARQLFKEMENAAAAPEAPRAPQAPAAREIELEPHTSEQDPAEKAPAFAPQQAGGQAFDLSEVGTGPADEPEPGYEAVFEMPVPEMETLAGRDAGEALYIDPEDIAEPIEFEEAELISEEAEVFTESRQPEPVSRGPKKPAGGYAVDISGQTDLKEIFGTAGEVAPEEVSSPDSVYEIREDLSAFELDGFKVEFPRPAEAPTPGPEPRKPAPAEPFETETLAELYISQGFYDRAINIYKHLLVEYPDDASLKQKLGDLYLLAGVQSAKAAEKARKESVPEPYEPVDFGEVKGQVDDGAAGRLAQFLDNIRRKAGQ